MVAGCGAKTAKFILAAVNTIFVLLGLGIGIAGLVFKFGWFKEDIVNTLQKTDINGTDTYSLLNSAALIFIVVGFFIFGIGIFGCLGACCEWRPLLVVYALVVAILLIIQIVGVALFAKYRGDIETEFQSALNTTFYQYYTNDTDVQKGFQQLFKEFECCGVNGYMDFTSQGVDVPSQCCGLDSGSCTSSSNNLFKVGCGQKFIDDLGKYNTTFIAIGVCILIFQLLCVLFSFCLCCAIGRDD